MSKLTKSKLQKELKSLQVKVINDDNFQKLIIDANCNVEETLDKIFELQKKGAKITVDLKPCPYEVRARALKHSLKNYDLKDPLLLLNILNLVKIYNDNHEDFFNNPDICINEPEELVNIKLFCRAELKAFKRQLCIYFISLFKSYNKMIYTPTDTKVVLPDSFKSIILSTDILTLSGIFSSCDKFSTEELVNVENAFQYVSSLMMKSYMNTSLLNEFLNYHRPNKLQILIQNLISKFKRKE